MYKGNTVGVVIPAYNEEEYVGDVVAGIPEFVDRAYIVDDASTDQTWREIIVAAAATNVQDREPAIADGGTKTDGRVVPIRHDTNSGRGASVKTGYRRALEDDMDAIAVMDGDDQMDPTRLDRLLDPIVDGRADYTKGNRLLSREHRSGMSRWRLFGNTLLTVLTKIASGYWRMMDPQNGYTVVSAGTLRSIDLDGLYDDYGFLNDVLVKLNVADARIVDVAMPARYGDEQSGIKYSTFIPKLSTLLLRGFGWRLGTKYLLFDFHPLVGLYALGLLSAVGASLFAGWTVLGNLSPLNGVLAFLLFLFSGTLVTLAMIYDRGHNANLESRIDGDVR